MKLRHKKGFTIIELVIVIAVIGILTAVLVPTFINLTAKANEAADQSLVKNLNTALKAEEQLLGNKKNETLQDAVDDLEAEGYILENLVSKSGQDLLWNQQKNEFILNKDNEFSGKDYWQIVKEVPAYADQKYSYYAGKQFKAEVPDLKYGFDSGDNTNIATLNYVGNGSSAQNVSIRTNSAATTLTINGYVDSTDKTKGDVINHYGSAGVLSIVKCATGSYHENGSVSFAEISTGRIVLEVESNIEQIHINKKANEEAFDTVVIADKGTKTLPATITRDAVTVASASSVDVVTVVSSSGTSEVVKVYGEGSTGSTEKTETQNTDVNSVLGGLVLDNGGESKAMTEEAKQEAKTENVEKSLDEELLEKEFVVRVGADGYNSLHEAIAAAPENSTIKLLKDYDMEENESGYGYGAYPDPTGNIRDNKFFFNKSGVTFDLGGHTISNLFNNTFAPAADNITFKNGELKLGYLYKKTAQGELELGSYVLMSSNANNLKIENLSTLGGINISGGSATLSDMSYTGTKFYAVCSQDGASVVINGGNYSKLYEGAAGNMFWVDASSTATLTINGGYFEKASNIVFHNGTKKPVVRGGTYNFDISSYVDTGYSAHENGDGTWTVTAVN